MISSGYVLNRLEYIFNIKGKRITWDVNTKLIFRFLEFALAIKLYESMEHHNGKMPVTARHNITSKKSLSTLLSFLFPPPPPDTPPPSLSISLSPSLSIYLSLSLSVYIYNSAKCVFIVQSSMSRLWTAIALMSATQTPRIEIRNMNQQKPIIYLQPKDNNGCTPCGYTMERHLIIPRHIPRKGIR